MQAPATKKATEPASAANAVHEKRMEFLLAQLLNGLVYGMLLFLMAAGLSLIFGLMNVVSLAHGSFFMLGAFVGFAIYRATGSFWLALRAGADAGRRSLGIAMEMVFLRPLYRRGHLDQVLLTFGFTFIVLDVVQTFWGRDVLQHPGAGVACRAWSISAAASIPPTGCF